MDILLYAAIGALFAWVENITTGLPTKTKNGTPFDSPAEMGMTFIMHIIFWPLLLFMFCILCLPAIWGRHLKGVRRDE